MTSGSTVQRKRNEAQRVTREPAFEWLARSGLAARGVVYAVIGILAFEVAIGVGGKTRELSAAPWSRSRASRWARCC